MGTIPTSRCSKQRLNPNLRVGKALKPSADAREQALINKAIVHLNKAKKTANDSHFTFELSESFRILRNLLRENL